MWKDEREKNKRIEEEKTYPTPECINHVSGGSTSSSIIIIIGSSNNKKLANWKWNWRECMIQNKHRKFQSNRNHYLYNRTKPHTYTPYGFRRHKRAKKSTIETNKCIRDSHNKHSISIESLCFCLAFLCVLHFFHSFGIPCAHFNHLGWFFPLAADKKRSLHTGFRFFSARSLDSFALFYRWFRKKQIVIA